MQIGETLYVTKRAEWRKWLAKNHDKKPDIWLIFYKKSSGKPRLSYDDAVLEALCFGWIDSIVKTVDNESFAQRFSPRKKTSVLSQLNIERTRELIKQNKMTEVGLKAISHAYDPNTDQPDDFVIPESILKRLKKDKTTWEIFQKLPKEYIRTRIAYIESRKRHGIAMYTKALTNFLKATHDNKRIGVARERNL